MNPTPAMPIPDPALEPGTKGATGGASVTGEVREPDELGDDSANGSRNLVQQPAPDTFRDDASSSHGSR